MGSYCLMDTEFEFFKMKSPEYPLHNNVTPLNFVMDLSELKIN